MSLSRTHVAFLGIISVFAGLIWPGTHSGRELLSYLMTDMRWLVYSILIAMIPAFALAAMRKWSLYRLSIILIILGVVTLWVLTFSGSISSVKTGGVVWGFDWGWIFLVIGTLLLGMSYRKMDVPTEETTFTDAIDTIIGMVWGFALACIAGILILSSLSFFSRGQSHDILTRMYASGEITTLSGGVRSVGSSTRMPLYIYDRGWDSLLSMRASGSGNIWTLVREGKTSTGLLKSGLTPLLLDGSVYARDESGYAYSGGRLLLGSHISGGESAIVYKRDGTIEVIHAGGRDSIPYKGIVSAPIALSWDQSTLVWVESQSGGKMIVRDGKSLGDRYERVEKIDISRSGQSVTAIVASGSESILIKNGTTIGTLPANTLSGSYKSNGSHSLFITMQDGVKRVSHDMEIVSKDLQEVRETFVEEDGGSYAYFGRPIGEDTYCLFTRYKGNLCGLEGYMNPVLWADGGSIIFAGKKDGIWNIYRNSDIIVRDTGYTAKNIDYDYVYFDTTNPRTYLFIERDPTTRLYSYRKNGTLLPWTWKDISTDVYFGYDSHILTAAQDEVSWRMLEL